jgi:hypothetical protein
MIHPEFKRGRGMEVTPTVTTVAAAASVPSSFVSMKV